MDKNYFRAQPNTPFHLSVGAVLLNSENLVGVNFFPRLRNMSNVYFLMSKTMQVDKSIEQMLHLGLAEEFGVTADIQHFLGSHTTLENWFGEKNLEIQVQKTTLFFLVNLVENLGRVENKNNDQLGEIKFVDIDFLIDQMPGSATEWNWQELDCSEVLKKAKLLM